MLYVTDVADEETCEILAELVDEYHYTGDISALRQVATGLDPIVVTLLERDIGESLQ